MQKAINIALGLAVVVLAAGLGYAIATRPAPGPDAAQIRSLVAQAMADTAVAQTAGTATAQFDGATLGPMIKDYLLANPGLLETMSIALETERRTEEAERSRIALDALHDDIYNDPFNVVLGNPDGDVTLVEMFDYNCGYCRQVVADVMALVDEDPNLRVILKEFPILSQASIDAARIGILVNREDADYQAFHTALYSGRGTVDTEAALAAAESVGLNRVLLELDMNAQDVTAALQRTYQIAQGLGVSGTPTFIIGNEVIPGAVPKAELTRRIASMRECGSTVCGPEEG
ncbi:DsbA family protein [Pelagibacterium lacus]|uniref:DsbA family protein n=1 Tax=Pelagibacterium lacus TaxID=2282655 RepID=A0A369WAX8_9HYPH|nr:DsbA family protein [Pelagibacterium lacus]RDE09231.1 DsbA family protein [Pelagibacterium lacus]